jgi:hypothetical protein
MKDSYWISFRFNAELTRNRIRIGKENGGGREGIMSAEPL